MNRAPGDDDDDIRAQLNMADGVFGKSGVSVSVITSQEKVRKFHFSATNFFQLLPTYIMSLINNFPC